LVVDETSWSAPPHPVVPLVEGGDGLERRLMTGFVIAIVPLLEEIVFRGLLLGYFLDRWRRWQPSLRAVAAAGATALLFAVAHRQGLASWPVLFGSGLAFALVRDWRGSLIAPMAMHVAHNGIVLLALSAS
jgi:membrane protease YdiL (CAAX protease family)